MGYKVEIEGVAGVCHVVGRQRNRWGGHLRASPVRAGIMERGAAKGKVTLRGGGGTGDTANGADVRNEHVGN